MEYILTVRIPFPQRIKKVVNQEKKRFTTEYGSSYASPPHITLYLGRYTKQGFAKFIRDLQLISIKRFTISLLKPKMTLGKGLQRRFFFLDVSNKKGLYTLHVAILKIASRYRGSLLRKKDRTRLRQGLYGKLERNNLKRYGYARVLKLFNPHITLGEVGINKPQPALVNIRKNLRSIKGAKLSVARLTAMLYEKESEKKGAKLTQEITVRLR